MKCPMDGAELRMADRQGVEIDYCPECRGVWLDRGELDKIIERAQQDAAPALADAPAQIYGREYRPGRGDGYREFDYDDDDDDRYRPSGYGGYGSYGPKKKKRGLLAELFDFD